MKGGGWGDRKMNWPIGPRSWAATFRFFSPVVRPFAGDAKPKPVGEWNQSKILVKRNHIEHWLNGAKTVDVEYGSDAWKEAVAKSKFKGNAAFANPAKGHIILQDHGDEVWFRNLKIREAKD